MEPEIKLPTSLDHRKSKSPRKTSALLTTPKFLTVWITKKLWKILQEMGIPGHFTCFLRNLYAGQEKNGLVGSPCCPRDSQESSPTPQFKSINSSALSFLYNVKDSGQLKMKFLQEMEIPDYVTCLLRNLYAGQEATVRTRRNERLVQNGERRTSRQYIITLFI